MSMSYHAVFGYGLLIPAEDADEFVSKYAADASTDADEENPYEFWDMEAEDALYITDDMYDNVSTWKITNNSGSDYDDAYDGIFLYADKQGALFMHDGRGKAHDAMYDSPNELVKEFSDKYGTYLPDDFDIKSHLCLLAGAYIC